MRNSSRKSWWIKKLLHKLSNKPLKHFLTITELTWFFTKVGFKIN
jgi:hypothetical protein